MPLFDAKALDSDPDGMALLAAVLYPSPRAQVEARERGRQRMARANSTAAFTVEGTGAARAIGGEGIHAAAKAKATNARTTGARPARSGRAGAGRPRSSLGAA